MSVLEDRMSVPMHPVGLEAILDPDESIYLGDPRQNAGILQGAMARLWRAREDAMEGVPIDLETVIDREMDNLVAIYQGRVKGYATLPGWHAPDGALLDAIRNLYAPSAEDADPEDLWRLPFAHVINAALQAEAAEPESDEDIEAFVAPVVAHVSLLLAGNPAGAGLDLDT